MTFSNPSSCATDWQRRYPGDQHRLTSKLADPERNERGYWIAALWRCLPTCPHRGDGNV